MKKAKISKLMLVLFMMTALAFSSLSVIACQPQEHTHSYGEWTTVTAAGCTTDGSEKRVCDGCDETAEGHQEIRPISALGHDWDDGEVTTQPKFNSKGVKTFACDNCDEERTEDVDALGIPGAFRGTWVCDEGPTFVITENAVSIEDGEITSWDGAGSTIVSVWTYEEDVYDITLTLSDGDALDVVVEFEDERIELTYTKQTTPAPGAQEYNITVALNNAAWGEYTLSPEGPYEEGDEVVLTVTAEEGYEVVSVMVDETPIVAETDGTYIITVANANITVNVTLAEIVPEEEYEINVILTDTEAGDYTLSPEGPYHEGDEVVLTVTPIAGYLVESVKINGQTPVRAESDGTYVITVEDADIDVVVNLELDVRYDYVGSWEANDDSGLSLEISLSATGLAVEYYTSRGGSMDLHFVKNAQGIFEDVANEMKLSLDTDTGILSLEDLFWEETNTFEKVRITFSDDYQGEWFGSVEGAETTTVYTVTIEEESIYVSILIYAEGGMPTMAYGQATGISKNRSALGGYKFTYETYTFIFGEPDGDASTLVVNGTLEVEVEREPAPVDDRPNYVGTWESNDGSGITLVITAGATGLDVEYRTSRGGSMNLHFEKNADGDYENPADEMKLILNTDTGILTLEDLFWEDTNTFEKQG